MIESFSDRCGGLLTGRYDCVDRIVLNAYFSLGSMEAVGQLLGGLHLDGQGGDRRAEPVDLGPGVLFAFGQVLQQMVGHQRLGHAIGPARALSRQDVVAVPVSRRVMLSVIDQ
jgi:hypothetical protein